MKHLKFFIFLCILTFTVSCGQQKKFIQYKVIQGETMLAIAKKLDMKTKDLRRLNPDISSNPEVNTVIIIPSNKLKKVKTNRTNIKSSGDLLDAEDTVEEEAGDTIVSEKEKKKETF